MTFKALGQKKKNESDLISEHEVFFQNFDRVWRKKSEAEEKKIELSKQVCSFTRDLRVPIQNYKKYEECYA